jgi:hypothetical protein
MMKTLHAFLILTARFAAWNDEMTEPLWSFPAAEGGERRTKRRNRNATNREDRYS